MVGRFRCGKGIAFAQRRLRHSAHLSLKPAPSIVLRLAWRLYGQSMLQVLVALRGGKCNRVLHKLMQ